MHVSLDSDVVGMPYLFTAIQNRAGKQMEHRRRVGCLLLLQNGHSGRDLAPGIGVL